MLGNVKMIQIVGDLGFLSPSPLTVSRHLHVTPAAEAAAWVGTLGILWGQLQCSDGLPHVMDG